MILSIGMIVKNEERILRDCLLGIKPILEQVESELIIADTGSTDSTVSIAKEFTNIVYEIEWKNDFAAARNTTINRSKGKWYMFLDADEVFKDVSDIVQFFNSGEYKHYESARHIHTNNDTGFTFEPVRLFKKHRDLKFVYKIHEQIPAGIPQKKLNSVAIHYDARYLSVDEKEKKYERNMAMLLQAYESNPTDNRIISLIVNDAMGEDKLDDAKKFIDRGLRLFKSTSLDIVYHFLAMRNALYYYNTERYEEAVKVIREYFSTTKRMLTSAVNMRIMEGASLMVLCRWEEAKKAFITGLSLLDDYDSGKLDDEDVVKGLVVTIRSDARNYILKQTITCCLNCGDFDEAEDMADTCGENLNLIADEYFSSAFKRDDFDGIKKLCRCADDKKMIDPKKIYRILSLIENRMENSSIKHDLARTLSLEASNGDYIRLQRVRIGDYRELDYFLNSDKSFSGFYGDIVVAAMKERLNFSGFVGRMDIGGDTSFIDRMVVNNDNLSNTLGDFIKDNPWYYGSNCMKTVRLLYMLCEACFSIEDDKDAKAKVFEAYIRIYDRYLSYVYKEGVYTEEAVDILPERCGFVYFAGKAYACKDNGNISGFVSNLREALKMDASMKDMVATIVKALNEPPSDSPQEQLKKEAMKIKKAIISLIKSGNKEQARQLLEGYEQIMPADPEIKDINEALRN